MFRWAAKSYAGFDEDFATVNPYLGSDGVKPFIDVCKEENKGLFILVKNIKSFQWRVPGSSDRRTSSL